MKGRAARSRKPKLKRMHQTPEMMKGQAMDWIPSSAVAAAVVFTTAAADMLVMLSWAAPPPQISSVSISLEGRKGRTRKVAARKPAPIRAWNAIVKGLNKKVINCLLFINDQFMKRRHHT